LELVGYHKERNVSLKRLFYIIFILLLSYGQVFAAGSKFDRSATPAEVLEQKRDKVWLSPASIPHIMSAPGTIAKLQLDHNVETLAANKTLVITDKVIQRLDPDGTDRDILLPAEATATDLVFLIYNRGGEVGENLNIQDDASGALTEVGYGQMGICTCDGTTWVALAVSCNDVCVLNFRGKEENTSNIITGQPVYISGATGVAFPNYGLANCIDSSKIRVKGLAAEDVAQNATGYVRVKGLLEHVDSTKGGLVNPLSQDWTAGDQLWVATTTGGLTNIMPTSGRTIKVGTALTVEDSNSKILVDVRENPVFASAASGEDLVLRMGDNAGANKVSLRDYANNEVASIDSNGRLTATDPTSGSHVGDRDYNDNRYTGRSYGIMWNENQDKYIRIGDPYLFIHDDLKRCILSDAGAVVYYLDPTSSYNRESVSPSVAGTCDANATKKITDTGVFTGASADYVGRYVKNIIDSTYAMITAKDDNDTLSIQDDIFVIGETFEICTAVLDGTDGQVVVEILAFYHKYSWENALMRVCCIIPRNPNM
jgi:hypothetical protein